MDDVRIILSASRTPLGSLIRWCTKSQVSHCMVEFPVWGRRMVAEARVGGVRIVPSTKARRHVVIEYRCRFPSRAGLAAISDEAGEKYDYSGLFVIGWAIIAAKWLRLSVKRWRWKSESIKCSELIVIFLRASGVKGAELLPMELTTPEDIRGFCQTQKSYFEVIINGNEAHSGLIP